MSEIGYSKIYSCGDSDTRRRWTIANSTNARRNIDQSRRVISLSERTVRWLVWLKLGGQLILDQTPSCLAPLKISSEIGRGKLGWLRRKPICNATAS